MNTPRITCSSLQGWTPALLNTPFPQSPTGTARLCLSLQLLSLCAVPAASPVLSYSPSPYRHSQRPGAKEQEAVKVGKAKEQALSAFRSTHVPQTSLEVAFPSLAEPDPHLQQPLAGNTFSVWLKLNMKWPEKLKSFLLLKCSTLLIKLGKTHQNPKSKGMLCSTCFWQIIIISFIYKNQTAPKPQLHTQKKLLAVSKDYRNEFNCLTEQHIVFIPHFAGLGNHCSLNIGWQSKKCLTLLF